MTSALASCSQERHILASGALDDVLADLIKRRGRVQVRSEATAGEAAWDGVIAEATDEYLSLELVMSDANANSIQVSTPLRVVFQTGRTRYTFSTPCVAVSSEAESTLVRVKRPIGVTKVERRRSPRRGLREPVRLRIRSDRAGHALDEWASLLNLSADGLACRISSNAAVGTIDDVLRVSFALDHPDARFDLRARVINVTQGASDDISILGLEFLSGGVRQVDRDRLVTALAATGPH